MRTKPFNVDEALAGKKVVCSNGDYRVIKVFRDEEDRDQSRVFAVLHNKITKDYLSTMFDIGGRCCFAYYHDLSLSMLDETPLNVVTSINVYPESCTINLKPAFHIMQEEHGGMAFYGHKVSGRKASIFLIGIYGSWYDEGGRLIKGNLYFKPKS